MGVNLSTRSRAVIRGELRSEDPLVKEKGLFYLAELTNDNEAECKEVVNTADGMRAVMQGLSTPVPTVQRSCAAVLRNITSPHHCGELARSHCRVLGRKDCAQDVLAVLSKCDNETRLYLIEVLGNLGRYDVPLIAVALKPLVSFVRAPDTELIRVKAIDAIRWIVRDSKENATAFLSCSKGLEAVLEAFERTRSETVRCHAALALSELCTLLHHVSVPVFEQDRLKLCCRMINSASAIQRHAGMTLCASILNMFESTGTVSADGSSTVVSQVAVVMSLEEDNIALRIVKLLCLRTESELMLLASLKVLRCMAFRSPNSQKVACEAGAIELLVRMFTQHDDNAGLRLAIAAANSQLFRFPLGREIAMQLNVVPLYAELIASSIGPLRSGCEAVLVETVTEALLSLFFIAETKEFRLVIGSAVMDSIGIVLQFPYAEHPTLLDTATSVIRNVVFRCPENKAAFMALPCGLSSVVSLLSRSASLGQQHAAGIVMALLMEPEYQDLVVEAGALPVLVKLASSSESLRTVAQAIAALWNLCIDNHSYREKLFEFEVHVIVMKHVGNPDFHQSILEPSAGCLSALVELTTVQHLIAHNNLVLHIIHLLKNPSLQVQESCICILRIMVDNPATRDSVLMHGITERLYEFIQSCTVPAREHAAAIIKFATYRRDESKDDEERRLKFAAIPGAEALDKPAADFVEHGVPIPLSRNQSFAKRKPSQASAFVDDSSRRSSVQFSALDGIRSFDRQSPTAALMTSAEVVGRSRASSVEHESLPLSRKGSDKSVTSPQVAASALGRGGSDKSLPVHISPPPHAFPDINPVGIASPSTSRRSSRGILSPQAQKKGPDRGLLPPLKQ